ncbi:helix-turn-helix transcriptional regulator [Puniceicoccus vermicola]|uniref:Helix-turn-helix transcriptional regulator n=2 Tax=Puniceicoccus vermicola TaxID=388746 RepID=A0A7X1B2I2_9BACT|nr:helix-turn-helix transcriptional regulator [Puniceicoccus vermicola]
MTGLGQVMGRFKLFNWDPSVNRGRPFQRSDFYSERDFRQTAPYCLTLKPLGVDNHCAVYVPAGNDEISFFGIERKGGPDFNESDRAFLCFAQTLLGSARRLALERDKLISRKANPAALVRAGLTYREADVLTLLADGLSNQETASSLTISLETVKEHIRNIFAKTGQRNRFAASLWALKVTERDRTRSTILHLPRVVVPVRFS